MQCGLLFLCISIIKLKEWWFTKITVKVSDEVTNLSFISQCLGYPFLMVKDTIRNILYYYNFWYVCYAYLHTSWKEIFHCVCFMCFHGLYPDARAKQIPCRSVVLHLSKCRVTLSVWLIETVDFQSRPDTLNLWNFKVDGTKKKKKKGRKLMSSWNKKDSVKRGWAVELCN